MPGAVHQIEKGTMGWDPNRPREDPSPLLLPAHSFSRTFRDQRPTHSKKDRDSETEIQKDGPKKDRGRKVAMRRKNPCGLLLITQTHRLLLRRKNNHRDFLENISETFAESQGSLLHLVPHEASYYLNSSIMLRFCSAKFICSFGTLKKTYTFLHRVAKVASLPAFTLLTNTIHGVSSAGQCCCLTLVK